MAPPSPFRVHTLLSFFALSVPSVQLVTLRLCHDVSIITVIIHSCPSVLPYCLSLFPLSTTVTVDYYHISSRLALSSSSLSPVLSSTPTPHSPSTISHTRSTPLVDPFVFLFFCSDSAAERETNRKRNDLVNGFSFRLGASHIPCRSPHTRATAKSLSIRTYRRAQLAARKRKERSRNAAPFDSPSAKKCPVRTLFTRRSNTLGDHGDPKLHV